MATRTRIVTTTNPIHNHTLGRFISIPEIWSLVNDCISYMKEMNLDPYPCESIMFNTAFKKACGMTRRNNGKYRIEFSTDFLKVADEVHIKEVILHECIHLVPGCWDHKQKFKNIALVLNQHYKVDISRTISDPQYAACRKEEYNNSYKYKLVCPKCGKEWTRKNGGKWVQRYRAGITWFTCPHDRVRLVAKQRVMQDKFEPIPMNF